MPDLSSRIAEDDVGRVEEEYQWTRQQGRSPNPKQRTLPLVVRSPPVSPVCNHQVNGSNIKNILPELFSENLVRGRGLLARSLMKSQMASPAFSPVYAALVAVINTKFPENGELVLKRIILQFRRAYKRNDKPVCMAATKFIAHLVNQQVRPASRHGNGRSPAADLC